MNVSLAPLTIPALAAAIAGVAIAQQATPAPTPTPCRLTVFAPSGHHRTDRLTGRPGLVLSGGGFGSMPHAPVFAFLRNHIAGNAERGGNLVILKASGGRDYSDDFYRESRLASIQEILITPCTPRSDVDAAAKYVDAADAVLFAGGDQANYVRWKGSTLMAAISRLYDRGGVVGGGSAGLAVQGAIVYDSVAADRLLPDDQNVGSRDATHDPFEKAISFTANFFAWPPLRDVITDTHFARRDRFGRLAAFMARIVHDRITASKVVYGVAVDEAAVLLVDERGTATLYQHREPDGYAPRGAWILKGGPAARISPGKPLFYSVHVTHLTRNGEQYDLAAKRGASLRYPVTVDGSRRALYSRNPY